MHGPLTPWHVLVVFIIVMMMFHGRLDR